MSLYFYSGEDAKENLIIFLRVVLRIKCSAF